MSLTNDIPTKLRVPAQLALDAKSVVTTLSELQTLGTNNNLAYTYYKGMPVICAENLGLYRWRPVNEGETGGTLPSNFTYPAGIVSEDGVVYSNIAYNFFRETTVTAENITGIIALNNIGGGADIYKDFTTPLGVLTFNLRTIIKDALGEGKELIDSIEVVGDNVVVKGKTIGTTNLNIYVEEDGTIMIDSPVSTSNLFFYVDENSVADTETGSLSSPFKTLNKALDSFIGTGIWYNPQYKGYKISLLSACSLLDVAGDDYNAYTNLDINNLDIEGNGFYLGLYANPSPDYYPISTRRMVTAMSKTAGVLDFDIDLRFNNVVLQRTGTNAIIDHLNYSFPTADINVPTFPPPQNGSRIWITNSTLTNDTNRAGSGNFNVVPNPNDGGNPLLIFGVPVYASNTEPIGVPMVKSEGRAWNKQGEFRIGNSKVTSLSGPAYKFVNTTYNDFYDNTVIGTANYYRLYETEVDNYYSPRLGFYMIELEDVNYMSINNLKINWTNPGMNTTETIPRNKIIGGVESLFKLVNSTLHIVGNSSDQESVENLYQLDGTSGISLVGYVNNGQVNDSVHGAFKVTTPLPATALIIGATDSTLYSVIVDETGVDKSFVQYINGDRNRINNAPHSSYRFYVDNAAAKADGLIIGNIYHNTTLGGLTSVF